MKVAKNGLMFIWTMTFYHGPNQKALYVLQALSTEGQNIQEHHLVIWRISDGSHCMQSRLWTVQGGSGRT